MGSWAKSLFSFDFNLFRSNDLEDEELEIVGLGDVPEDGMIGGLLTGFDLAQPHSGILGSVMKHLLKVGFGHEMRAGAGGKITAAWEQLHRLEIDFLVAADGVF